METIKRNRIHKYSKNEIEYLREISHGKYNNEITKLFNKKFGLNLKESQIRSVRKNYGIKSGLTGRFKRGEEPWNKGKKMPGLSNSGTFKKGHTPSNIRKVGDRRINRCGYYEIKVKEPGTWKLEHRVIYEKNFGKIKKNYVIVFLDNNKQNLEINNLICISKSIHAIMNNRRWYSSNPEITKSRIILAKILKSKTSKKKQIKKRK